MREAQQSRGGRALACCALSRNRSVLACSCTPEKKKPARSRKLLAGCLRSLPRLARQHAATSYIVGNMARPPFGKFAPPAVALELVNGETTLPPPTATECELLPESMQVTAALVGPSTTHSLGVRLQA